jgi:S-adenosylmethionine synthetase
MDRVADVILDRVLEHDKSVSLSDCVKKGCRVAVEGVAKDNIVFLAGEITTRQEVGKVDYRGAAREVWEKTGYGDASKLIVLDHIQAQSPLLNDASIEFAGAGDQGIMVGYASDETPEHMPKEFIMARALINRLIDLRTNTAADGESLPWLRADAKSQVSLDASGQVRSVVIATQHDETVVVDKGSFGDLNDEARGLLKTKVILPILEQYGQTSEAIEKMKLVINGAGSFAIGGPEGDAGEVGRKIVVDAYGPRVPVGGGAYSGKDATKVDRSAAYMARYVAKAVVAHQIGGAKQCLVHIGYGIGQAEPEMVTAITDKGEDVAEWVLSKFSFKPWDIIATLGLWHPEGWSYEELSTYGHYGRSHYPWEKIANV